MRLTGLMSGMDTESMIQQLVAAKQTKVDDAKKAQTKLEWKQDAWKSLNTKLKNLQSKYLSSMRFTDAYTKKTTKVSNSNAVSVITGEDAMNGVQSLKIEKLAKTGYLTGGVVKGSDGGKVTAMSTLESLGVTDAGTINLSIGKNGEKSVDIQVNKDTTISDVLTQLKKAGLNANFDENNQRFFISAKESGADSDFSITATGAGLDALKKLGLDASVEGYNKTEGQDAVIYLNGAKFESKNNTFAINGLTFTALQASDEEITVTTQQDTDGIYDMVKNFLKEYNAIINEMDKLYNADSAKGYEPLTTEEKDALSDTEIEEYEKKIKDALLRKDENLSSISSAMRGIMAEGIEIGGKKMYLYDFGIETLGYFEAEENERNAYHIAGDPDDANTVGKADKLKSMIANDPDTTIKFFTKLSQNLYDKMSELSSSVKDYRSFGSFYDDKKMKSDYESYTTKIKELEQKLNDYEDKWYKKFAAMETAMAKMQSGASAVTALLGGS
ncbi:MAG: flagellar filament capping protein FliD [Lachnospiraceae bacterium]|nr:flagellar filament capping protein FliD [Lachnospiraceae bacterium]